MGFDDTLVRYEGLYSSVSRYPLGNRGLRG